MRHALAWVAWVGAILVILSTTRNPWYIGLVLSCILIVNHTLPPQSFSTAPVPISLWRFGLTITLISAWFNALTVHIGETHLFTMPEIIPYFGGIVTLEALLYGALNGLVLTGLFATFTVFNKAVSVRAMIRLVPRAFYPVAVIIAIAITFVPVTLRQYHNIRQAQMMRGHQLSGLKDWLPLVMPLLIGGLERALQLAETMTARGFARADTSYKVYHQFALVVSLLLILSGWLLRLVWGYITSGSLMLGGGLILMVGILWMMGRGITYTSYRPHPWTIQDWGIVLSALMPVSIFLFTWPTLDQSTIYYYPYPQLSWPHIQPLIGLSLSGLCWPAIITRISLTKAVNNGLKEQQI